MSHERVNETPMLYTVDEAGYLLGGLSRASLYNQLRSGAIKPTKIGRRTFVSRHELEEFMRRNTKCE
jgi:excisionase family DNA binding protein